MLVRPEDYYVALMELTADPHRDRTVLSADAHVRPARRPTGRRPA
ncbi:hypothetical protein [Streptomyces sp. IBTA2]|nr:hypothetical protein [Streptomyces sp. IBTA2]